MTMKEIAEIAGVSIATVSKVINGKDEKISKKTREKVLKVVEEEGYYPNNIARSLKTMETKVLGVILPNITDMFFAELFAGIEDKATEMGYSILLCLSDNDQKKEKEHLKSLYKRMVDAILLLPTEETTELVRSYKEVPIILLGRDISMDECAVKIYVNNKDAIYKSTKFLIDEGCRNIAFISSNGKTKSVEDRIKGYKLALEEDGISINEKLIYLNDFNVETGFYGIKNIIEKFPNIDGVATGSDNIAIGVIRYLLENNYKVPEDIKVIGMGNISISKYLYPPLTTIEQPIYKMGRDAADIAINIKGDNNLDKEIILNTDIIRRGTV